MKEVRDKHASLCGGQGCVCMAAWRGNGHACVTRAGEGRWGAGRLGGWKGPDKVGMSQHGSAFASQEADKSKLYSPCIR